MTVTLNSIVYAPKYALKNRQGSQSGLKAYDSVNTKPVVYQKLQNQTDTPKVNWLAWGALSSLAIPLVVFVKRVSVMNNLEQALQNSNLCLQSVPNDKDAFGDKGYSSHYLGNIYYSRQEKRDKHLEAIEAF
jgi:hypothetical protein